MSIPRRIPLAQGVKLLVYGLLLINFAQYIAEDMQKAAHTARAGWSLLDWAGVFATTLDEAAWFVLLLLLELETYQLSDAALTRRRLWVMHALRGVCCLFIAHTVYAYAEYGLSLHSPAQADATALCDLAGEGRSFTRNLHYWALDPERCGQLATSPPYYLFEDGTLVTDASGLRIERELAWVDVLEASAWLLVVVLIEALVRLQDRGVTSGTLLRGLLGAKLLAYGLLWCAACYWAWRGHWLYVWDEALWILGFAAIGMNLSEWRAEIDADGRQGA